MLIVVAAPPDKVIPKGGGLENSSSELVSLGKLGYGVSIEEWEQLLHQLWSSPELHLCVGSCARHPFYGSSSEFDEIKQNYVFDQLSSTRL